MILTQKHIRHMAAAVILAFMLEGCSDRPKDIIPEKKMVQIMADLQIAEAYQQSGRSVRDGHTGPRDAVGVGILAGYGVSPEEMDSTLAWYGRNMDEYAKLYKKVDKELGQRRRKYAKAAGESMEKENASSTDLWAYERHMVLSDRNISDGITVSIPNPDMAPGDRLIWKMRVTGSYGPRDLMLGVDYSDGTSDIIHQSSHDDKWTEISLQTDSTLKVGRIFGIMKGDTGRGQTYIDSIQLLHQPMKSDDYYRIGYQKRIGAPARKTAVKNVKDSLQSDITTESDIRRQNGARLADEPKLPETGSRPAPGTGVPTNPGVPSVPKPVQTTPTHLTKNPNVKRL